MILPLLMVSVFALKARFIDTGCNKADAAAIRIIPIGF
jgi:hypothetical protein